MDAGMIAQNYIGRETGPYTIALHNQAVGNSFRNLGKSQLGGVIFGCTNSTIKECLSKQLFGLPAQHFYVRNIDSGLPLFLFNYSDRTFHGIFEAVGPGQMNINPYGWTANGSERTQYPSQVRIRVRLHCKPLLENQFRGIIADNYYKPNHFWFELDHAQSGRLISLLSSGAFAPCMSLPQNSANSGTRFHVLGSPDANGTSKGLSSSEIAFPSLNQSNRALVSSDGTLCSDEENQTLEADPNRQDLEHDEIDHIYTKLKKLAQKREHQDKSPVSHMHFEDSVCLEHQRAPDIKNEKNPILSDIQSMVPELIHEIGELKTFHAARSQKMGYLEQKLAKAEAEILQLKDRCMALESIFCPSKTHVGAAIETPVELNFDMDELIYLVGGYDDLSCLSGLSVYSPSQDVMKSLSPMKSIRSYASVAKLNGDIYVFGGGDGDIWYDSVESYNPANDQWTLRPSLNGRKGSLAGVTLDNKIFAIGGGNGIECFSEMEMMDLNIGAWISTRSMLQKRFALGAAEVNGVIYAVGGYDGDNYLNSAERFDPREHSWTKIGSMNVVRGSHSVAVLNEKLYAIGGFNGNAILSSVEIFDPRLGSWVYGDPMNEARGFSAAVSVKESVYAIGGIKDGDKIVETVELYKEGRGWEATGLRGIGKRCYFSAIAG